MAYRFEGVTTIADDRVCWTFVDIGTGKTEEVWTQPTFKVAGKAVPHDVHILRQLMTPVELAAFESGQSISTDDLIGRTVEELPV